MKTPLFFMKKSLNFLCYLTLGFFLATGCKPHVHGPKAPSTSAVKFLESKNFWERTFQKMFRKEPTVHRFYYALKPLDSAGTDHKLEIVWAGIQCLEPERTPLHRDHIWASDFNIVRKPTTQLELGECLIVFGDLENPIRILATDKNLKVTNSTDVRNLALSIIAYMANMLRAGVRAAQLLDNLKIADAIMQDLTGINFNKFNNKLPKYQLLFRDGVTPDSHNWPLLKKWGLLGTTPEFLEKLSKSLDLRDHFLLALSTGEQNLPTNLHNLPENLAEINDLIRKINALDSPDTVEGSIRFLMQLRTFSNPEVLKALGGTRPHKPTPEQLREAERIVAQYRKAYSEFAKKHTLSSENLTVPDRTLLLFSIHPDIQYSDPRPDQLVRSIWGAPFEVILFAAATNTLLSLLHNYYNEVTRGVHVRAVYTSVQNTTPHATKTHDNPQDPEGGQKPIPRSVYNLADNNIKQFAKDFNNTTTLLPTNYSLLALLLGPGHFDGLKDLDIDYRSTY